MQTPDRRNSGVSVLQRSSPVVVPEVLQVSIAQEEKVQQEGWVLLSPPRQYVLPYLLRCLHVMKAVQYGCQKVKLQQRCH